jgi:hypothetical protein
MECSTYESDYDKTGMEIRHKFILGFIEIYDGENTIFLTKVGKTGQLHAEN